MKPTLILMALGCIMLAGCRMTDEAPSQPVVTLTHIDLDAWFESEWDRDLERAPTRASSLGDRRWNDQWPDVRPETQAQDHEHHKAVLAKLEAMDRSRIRPEDQLNYDLFLKRYQRRVEGFPFRLHLIPLNQRGGIQTADELADALRFKTLRDYEDWLARLHAFPEYMNQTIALMREGMRRKMLLPKVVMKRVPGQIRNQIRTKPEESPFYKPFRAITAEIPEAEQTRLRAAASMAIAQHIVPAYRIFAEFFENEYLPACYDKVGAWQLPNGKALYAFAARYYTTTDLTPDEIHDIGMKEVNRIRAAMEQIREQVGFEGTLNEFFEHLRSDPRYYFKTGEELLHAYRAMSKRIDPLMVQLFRTMPRIPYGVEPIPAAIAPDTTTAYYRRPAADGSRAGSYFVNLYKPETRPKFEMMALSLHEAVPGHHFQIALAMELEGLPKFRRYAGYTSFIEGWGLYAEHLGEELGLYEDPYDKLGQLTYEMWRAIRLVVDTGIHHKQWTRQQAIEFFRHNAAKSEQDIVNEVDRYIAWPGQALAYKIGELRIKELRARAEVRLEDRFDVKAFHDAVLGAGAVPLDLLERRVNEWIESH